MSTQAVFDDWEVIGKMASPLLASVRMAAVARTPYIDIVDYDVAFSSPQDAGQDPGQNPGEENNQQDAGQQNIRKMEVALLMFDQNDIQINLPKPTAAILFDDRIELHCWDFSGESVKVRFVNLPALLFASLAAHVELWVCAMMDGLVVSDWRIPLSPPD